MTTSNLRREFELTRVPDANRKGMNQLFGFCKDLAQVMRELNVFGDLPDNLAEYREQVLAISLVDMAEDLHHGGRLWNAVEAYNREQFGSPLPGLFREGDEALPPLDTRRFQFFLYTVWEHIAQVDPMGPRDERLFEIADSLADYLRPAFSSYKAPSQTAEFLNKPNPTAWAIKRKLVWLGTSSYLLRILGRDIQEQLLEDASSYSVDDESNANFTPNIVEICDQYITSCATGWSGLFPTELLGRVLNLEPAEYAELVGWEERLGGIFRVLQIKSHKSQVYEMRVRNVLRGDEFAVRMDSPRSVWKGLDNGLLTGYLVPWKGAWYWSGSQNPLGYADVSDEEIKKITRQAGSHQSLSLKPEEMERAWKLAAETQADMIRHHGGQLARYPSQLAFLQAEQARIRAWNELRGNSTDEIPLPEGIEDVPETPALVFFTHRGGVEFVEKPDLVTRALGKPFNTLEGDEEDAIGELIYSRDFSAQLLEELARRHGSVGLTSYLGLEDTEANLKYLLHRYKGDSLHKGKLDFLAYSGSADD